jgi:hypothetical protein
VIETPADRIEEFLSLPLGAESDHPLVDVQRGHPDEFERVYDCVDAAFGTKRPRALFDWLYRQNPYGLARVWNSVHRETGQILKTGAFFPWPIWRGDEPLEGSLSGDAGTVPEWQRKGLSLSRRIVRRSHPWHGKSCAFAGPNEGSRIVSNKAGEGDSIMGPLKGGVAILRAAPLLERVGLPSVLSSPLGAVADLMLSPWQSLAVRKTPGIAGQIEPVNRFTSDFDDVTLKTMSFPGYWSPHNSDFLNWRYLDHPVESYSGYALVENERAVAYAILRIDGPEATLAEFAVDTKPSPRAIKLLAAALEIAREAGCAYVNFFGTPVWRHWRLFHRAGFLPYKTSNYLDATYKPDVKASRDFRNWQLTPGDRDYH